ncbi:hypothetical protein RHMOL_Rhmol07G0238000 [Rhododendron molle]|uniref:Uncharacterized protein n=1 Tax=Rhododendron molle TaxID=49168 RepID=A0ACC0N5I7_RHOML|nr:hypothetical protein RHMOL_Rhmol07G0238000 [Rhododendron molle]
MSVAEMRMLRWMCGKTRRDRIRNEMVREMASVAPIEEKLRENRLSWFGHAYRRPEDAVAEDIQFRRLSFLLFRVILEVCFMMFKAQTPCWTGRTYEWLELGKVK